MYRHVMIQHRQIHLRLTNIFKLLQHFVSAHKLSPACLTQRIQVSRPNRQVFECLLCDFTRSFNPLSSVPATLYDSPSHEALRTWRCNNRLGRRPAARLTKQSNIIGVASKLVDIFRHPFKNTYDVLDTEVPRPDSFAKNFLKV